MRRQTEHRIRKAAGLARPGWIWAAAVIMNGPAVAGAAVLGWFAFTADAPALVTVTSILFVMVLFWALVITLDSWRVLRRFTRRESFELSLGSPRRPVQEQGEDSEGETDCASGSNP